MIKDVRSSSIFVKCLASFKKAFFYLALPMYMITIVPIILSAIQTYIGFQLFFWIIFLIFLALSVILVIGIFIVSDVLSTLRHVISSILHLTNRL